MSTAAVAAAAPLSATARMVRFRTAAVEKIAGQFAASDWFHKVGTASHAYWMLAHITYSRRALARVSGGTVPQDAWEKQFAKGSTPPAGEVEGLSPAALVAAFKQAGEAYAARLDVLTEADLAKDAPRAFPNGNTLKDFFLFLDFHESYHIGQMGLIARSLGKEVFG